MTDFINVDFFGLSNIQVYQEQAYQAWIKSSRI